MQKKAKYAILAFGMVALLAVVVPVTACDGSNGPKEETPGQETGTGDLSTMTEADLEKVLTNPDLDEIIVNYEGFTVSFNPTMHLPNWVAWTLTQNEVANGTVSRTDNFRPDPNVPGCATLADYKYSGYDRGHMAPAADMKWSAKAMDDCFFLTNMCPQIHELNDGAWKNLEEKCRTNATRDGKLTIICGPVLTEKPAKTIGDSKVPVPEKFFKVILTPSVKGGDAQAIGFIMPNSYVEGGMQATAVSVDEVERLTGHDFFYKIADATEAALESQNDFNRFSTGRASKASRRASAK